MGLSSGADDYVTKPFRSVRAAPVAGLGALGRCMQSATAELMLTLPSITWVMLCWGHPQLWLWLSADAAERMWLGGRGVDT